MASTYLERTATSGNQKIATFSGWFKKCANGVEQVFYHMRTDSTNFFRIRWDSSDVLNGVSRVSGTDYYVTATRKFRDTSAYYHIVFKIDTTQATASDRMKFYINGEEITVSASSYPAQNLDLQMNVNSMAQRVGQENGGNYYNGLMTHVHWIDGTAYDADTFGETDANGVWKPKTSPSVTYGTNGFFLKFENSGSMGTDSSGNANNFTVNGSLTQTLDTPSNVYATLNPLHKGTYLSGSTFSNGNTTFTSSATGGVYPVSFSTLAISKGKWYCEMKLVSATAGINGIGSGICDGYLGEGAYDYGIYGSSGSYYNNGTATSYSTSFSDNDILGIAMDLDNNKLYFAKNGVWQNSGDPTSGATGTGAISITAPSSTDTGVYHFGVCDGANATTATTQCNFGNGYFGTTAVSSAGSNGNGSIFEYDVPSGYYALNTKNLATYG